MSGKKNTLRIPKKKDEHWIGWKLARLRKGRERKKKEHPSRQGENKRTKRKRGKAEEHRKICKERKEPDEDQRRAPRSKGKLKNKYQGVPRKSTGDTG